MGFLALSQKPNNWNRVINEGTELDFHISRLMCDSEVMVLEAIVLRVEVMRLLINRMLPYLLLLEAYAHGSDSFIVVICVCCHNCVLSFTRKALQETYMNNTFVHLAVILMHSFAATTGDYQRFSAFFIIVGKKKEKKHLRY